MRTEQQILDSLLAMAKADERIRAAILNGSRANPRAPRDFFQDYDVVFLVTDVDAFVRSRGWIERFGELMIMQTPDEMGDPPPQGADCKFTYLMQFADGNRIDLTFYDVAKLGGMRRDSQSLLLLDKDGVVEPFPPPSEADYLPKPPSAKEFADCCNEFWWVCTYVAKGLWRMELPYARHMLEVPVRGMLYKMLDWHIGVRTGFAENPGKHGKYYQRHLEPELWAKLLETYPGADFGETWRALFTMGDLFRLAAAGVAGHFGYAYPREDDRRVTAHLAHIRELPQDAKEMY